MKYLKMLGLAAVTAMALMAFAGAGAGTASASVICKTKVENVEPCPAGWDLVLNDTIEADLEGSASLESTEHKTLDTCTAGGFGGVISSTGGAGGANETVKATVAAAALTWGTEATQCTQITKTIAGGELEIHSVAAAKGNGTLTAKGFEVTVSIASLSCKYTAGAGTDLGTLTSSTTTGATPTADINAVVNKTADSAFACPPTTIWNAHYKITTPDMGWVAAS